MKKLFGGIDLTWLKLVIFAVIAGLYTGLMALLPAAKDTSFADISISFEWWVLFGIIIIVNSKSPLDAAFKCLVFFLISQPLVYLVQVPFNVYGWGIFRYYPGWFKWTLLTFPMGFVGHYMKKDKWWSLLILVPAILFVGYHYFGFFCEARTFFPHHLLSAVFCVVTVLIYPLFIFKEKKLRLTGLLISIGVIVGMTVFALTQGLNTYNTTVLVEGGELNAHFDDTYTVELEDESFGKAYIVYEENIESYMVNTEFRKTGDTRLILTAPDGKKEIYDLTVYRSSYDIKESTEDQ